ncbi:peptidase S9 [Rhodopirellula sp. SM50]|nr:DPP IV N-terminal domain-containing protein [Rhodopirellula sp. SM50]PAY15931.1 peptidase S9 [Rhodopirellula sp. SM50]
MMPRQGFPVTLFSLIASAAIGLGPLPAHSADDSAWVSEAEPRLKAIYQKRQFRAKDFEGNWLPDSSGYTVRQQDPSSDQSRLLRYDVRTGEQVEVESPATPQPARRGLTSTDGKYRLEFRDQDLFVRDLKTDQRTRLTQRAPDRDLSFRDPQWSPDGKRVVFIESDATDVRMRPMLVPDDPSYPSVRHRRFARVGETINALRVGVVEIDGGELKWLPIESSPDGFYLGQVDWAGNSDELLVEKKSRFRDERVFLLASVDGPMKEIFRETNAAWAVGSQGKNSGLTWVRDGQAFIVISEKDGWRHAFLYSRDGKELALLTPGEYDIIDRAVVDEPGGWYYFYAAPDDGPRKYLYRVPLDGSGTLERITPANQPGTHDYDFSPDAKWAFHTYSTIDQPPVVDLVELEGHKVVRVLEDNRELRDRAETLMTPPTEFIRLEIDGGVSMDAWMIKPKNFDASKKYPVFIYVYGEPYAQTVLDQWGAAQNHFHRVIADLGYLVVSIDNRGTPAPKGAAWRRSIFGSLGPLSTEDQAAGLKELGRTRPYVDLSRVGIWGWSGGGSNTLNAMFRKPDDYHVGIAVVPKPQPHLYNAWFQEIYMRTREVNPDGYQRSAPLHFAEGLKGDLLIVTGSGETNTHIQIIEGLVDRLIELGKRFDYMVYPNRDHGLREGKGSELHVRMLIARYLVEHLPRGPR